MDAWLAFWAALWVGSSTISRRLVDWLCNAQPEPAKAPKKGAEPAEPDPGESCEQPDTDAGEEQPKPAKKKTKAPAKKPTAAEPAEGSALLRWCMVALCAAVAKGLPWTTAITVALAAAWIGGALILGYAAALADKPEEVPDEQSDTPAEPPPADQPHPSEILTLDDVAQLLHTLYTEGSGVHLATLAHALDRTPYKDHPAAPWKTADVRALLTRHGVRVRDGVRVPPKGGREGVHRDDFPPLPPTAPAAPVVGVVVPGQSNNNNPSNTPSYPFEVTDDPDNPAAHRVHHHGR
ncbi:hypothetical protein [Streptomyces sp. NPDC014685]|uniref:hypothetical protein n=1 Tax=Streptomyces sp. NPDC014685 TaxID=3364881 RepID=UPI0036F70B8A